MGVVIRCSEPLRADSIEQVLLPGAERDAPRPSSATMTSGKNHRM